MATVGVPKVCVACGRDVANMPRTKDRQGRYYCNPCWESAATYSSQKSRKTANIKEVHEDGPLEDFVHPSDNDNLLVAAVAQTASTSPELVNCPDCSGWFTIEQMSAEGVCIRCSKTTAAPPILNAPSQPARGSKPGVTKRSRSRLYVSIGAVVAVSLLFVIVALFAMGRPSERIQGHWVSSEQGKSRWTLYIDSGTLELSDGNNPVTVRYSIVETHVNGPVTSLKLRVEGDGFTDDNSSIDLYTSTDELYTGFVWEGQEGSGPNNHKVLDGSGRWERKH